MLLQPMPAIDRNSIIPPRPKLRHPRVLRLEFQSRDLFERVFLGIPFDAEVVDGLFVEVLEELGAE